jgi:hypothetical protein
VVDVFAVEPGVQMVAVISLATECAVETVVRVWLEIAVLQQDVPRDVTHRFVQMAIAKHVRVEVVHPSMEFVAVMGAFVLQAPLVVLANSVTVLPQLQCHQRNQPTMRQRIINQHEILLKPISLPILLVIPNQHEMLLKPTSLPILPVTINPREMLPRRISQ